MSDQKKLNKRLSDLFADLEGEFTRLPEGKESISGWTWVIDSRRLYSHCSPEVEGILGIEVEKFIGEPLTTFRLAADSQSRLAASLEAKRPKSELTLRFLTAEGFPVNVRMNIFYIPAEEDVEECWRGFTEIIQDGPVEAVPADIPPSRPVPPTASIPSSMSLSMPRGIAIEDDRFYSVSSPFSPIGEQSLALRQTLVHEATPDTPASLAVPIELQQQALGLLEFIDENPNRRWSREEQHLVEEVAGQLSLALENARLFEEAQRRSQELALINRVVSKVAASLDVNESLQIVTTELAHALDIQVNIALINPDGESLTMATDYSPRQVNPFVVGYQIPITGNPSTERVFETKKPVIIEDPQTNPLIASIHDLMRSLNVQSMGIFPIIIQDEIFGTVGLYILDEGRSLTQGEIQLVETILVQAATSIQNARLYESLAREQHLMQSLMDNIPTSIYFKDRQSRFLRINKAQAEVLGLSDPSEALDKTDFDFFSEDHARPAFEDEQNILRTGELLIGFEEKETFPDKPDRWVLTTKLPLRDEAGNITGTFGISTNITERKQAEIEREHLLSVLERRSTQLQTAAEISRAASSILEPNPLIMQAVNLIRDRFDLYYAGIFLVDQDGSLTGEAGRWAVLRAGTGEAGRIQVEQGHKLEIGGDSMIGQCVTIAQARISRLAPEEIHRYANPLLPNTQSEMALPLISRGKVIGAMTIQSTKPDAFSEEDVAVLRTMADQVANALQNANLFDQTQQNARELSILNEMSLTLSRQLDIEEIIQTIYRYTSQLMDTTYFFVALYNPDEDQVSFPLVVENNTFGHIPAMKKRRGLTQHVIDSKEPLLIYENVEQVIEELGLEEIVVGEPAKSWLGVPLLIGDEVLGVIATQNAARPRMFDTHDQELLVLAARQSAIALQNAQLFAQTQHQLADLSTIQETTSGLSAALTFGGVINTLLAHLTAAVRADYASVFAIEGANLIRVGVYPSGKNSPEIGEAISLEDFPLAQHVIETQKPLSLSGDDDRLREHTWEAFEAGDIAANATLPIVGPEGVLGTVSVSRKHPAANFSESELALMSTLANQAAVAILNARSYERVQEVAEEMTMLFDISQELTAAPLGVVEIADVVVRNFIKVFSIPECSISLLNPENNTLEIVTDLYMDDEQGQILRDERIGMIASLQQYPATARVMRTLRPLIVHASDPDADTAELAYMNEHDVKTLGLLPLAVKGQSIGILEMESRGEERHYSQSELNLALTLANQAAVALDNARLYEEQREITEQLRELDKLKSQFLANMSHELRTPLNSIIGFSRVIMKGIDGPVTELQTQDLSAIYNAGQHLLNMINDILDISKIEAGKMELAFEDVDLTQVIESVLSTARGLVKDKPVELRTEIPAGLPIIHADPTRIRQIMLNLLSNAAKFTDEGSITVTVRQQTGAGGRPEISIGVTDTGVGIAPEDQQDLFEPFTQVDGSPTRKTGGTGLGLSITRLLVDLHDGEINVESAPGKGSTFYFTLPISREEKHTILAVEGDPQVIELYQRYLHGTNYQLVPALDPSDALEMARELKPFAITLETNLPEQDGWEIFRKIRGDPDTKRIPIIICSLKHDPEKAQSMGIADYLPKPILREDLVNALHRISSNEKAEE